MARRRSSHGQKNEAFELFLDTITNAFGGIIFISLLVCILLQLAGTAAQKSEGGPLEETQLRMQIESVRAEIETLSNTRVSQEKLLETMGEATDENLLKQYTVLLNRQRELRKKRDELLVDLGRINADLKTLLDRLEELRQELAKLSPEAEALRKRVAEIRNRVPREKRLHLAHESTKPQIAILLSGGRMSFVLVYDAQGNATAPNEQDVNVREEVAVVDGQRKTRKVYMPRPGRGIAVTDDAAFAATFKRAMSVFDNRTYSVMIAVWPDSFKQAEILRTLLGDMGFGYGLLFIPTGEPVRTGDKNIVQTSS